MGFFFFSFTVALVSGIFAGGGGEKNLQSTSQKDFMVATIDHFTFYCLGSTKGAQRGC